MFEEGLILPLQPGRGIPARPGSPHTLATVDRRGRIDVRDVDTAQLVTRTTTALGRGARSLTWSADGRRLAVERPGMLVVLDVRSGRLQRIALPAGARTAGAAWSPRAPVLELGLDPVHLRA